MHRPAAKWYNLMRINFTNPLKYSKNLIVGMLYTYDMYMQLTVEINCILITRADLFSNGK
jgi:hypothetical protein